MANEAVFVLTYKSIDTIIANGGSSAWRLRPHRARKCPYVVCTRNANDTRVQGSEPHHTAFLIGKISDVTMIGNRYLIEISEFARVAIADAWRGGRNPVRYGTLDEIGVDPDALTWEPLEVSGLDEETDEADPSDTGATPGLTMMEAKLGLAARMNISPDSIEIIIRG